jgi:hypothetical protein
MLLSVFVLQAEANPSVRINEPVDFGTVLFVKIVAVPKLDLPEAAPVARLPMPSVKLLMSEIEVEAN